jgi:hypothetical protein
MTFNPSLTGRFDFIVKRFEEEKGVLEEFIHIINARAEIELSYSKGLAKVGQMV